MGSEIQASASSSAFSFISKGWREVRDSANGDLQLMKDRATSFKNLATAFDRELENFFNSALTFTLPTSRSSPPPAEIDFAKKLRPELSDIGKAHAAPEFRKKVLEKWGPRSKIRIDLSAIRNAIVSEVEDRDGAVYFDRFRRARSVKFKDFWVDSVKESRSDADGDGKSTSVRHWVPIRALQTRLKEFERKSSSELVNNFKNSELVEKLKSSWKSIYKEHRQSKEVSLLDIPELMAYLIRQSGPFLDQIGVKRDLCEKIVESLCSKHKYQLLPHSISGGESTLLGNESITDELDLRIANVLQITEHCYDRLWADHAKNDPLDRKRHIAIVTTASLPWMTGTAVNPLFRAAYLAQSAKQSVTLLVPWLCKSDQELVYPNQITFSSPEEQEIYIRNWLEERIGFKADFNISFYPGKFSKERRSIIPAGDTSQFIPSRDADIAILEEPEHLNWYHHGKRWTDKFNHVVGVVHTNYLEYIKREKNGALQAFLVKHINNWVTRAYCHKVLRLSAATQDLPNSIVCNVHGVNPKFLKIGEKIAAERELGHQAFTKGAYFLGKMVWAKGYRELIDLLSKHKSELDDFKMDVFGSGEDAHDVQTAAKSLLLNLNFQKGRDHADDHLHRYKVFINPSVSDVLCTATAEALAMGKFVVCADHPSNEFFHSFPNCLTYKTSVEFVAKVKEALANEPHPLTPELRYQLSWEAATRRFMECSELDRILNNGKDDSRWRTQNGRSMKKVISVPRLTELVDGGLAFAHYCLTGNEFLRLCTGAIPGTRDYDKEHCKDLHLLPPQVQNPIYGW